MIRVMCLGMAFMVLSGTAVMGNLVPAQLRCEYLVNPLGVGVRQPRLSWIVESKDRGAMQRAYQIRVASSPQALAADTGDLWDSGKIESDETLHIAWAGKPLASGQRVWWNVCVWDGQGQATTSEPATFQMGLLEPSDWKARWIGKSESPPDGPLPSLPPALLRKSFQLDKPIKHATAFVTALGLYELHLNGRTVGDHRLAPEWTNYHKRVQYQAYDVTPLLKTGDNAVGAMLADGWYAGRVGIVQVTGKPPWQLRAWYGNWPHLLVQLHVTYADGSQAVIVSDGSWKSTTEGPIRVACILDGERYDARKEMPGWDAPGFDDAKWQPVHVLEQVPAQLVWQHNEPMRVTSEVQPVAVKEPSPGVYVFDFGQNMAAVCRLKVVGAGPGARLRLRHAEMLSSDGNIYRDNLRIDDKTGIGARQEDEYITKGGQETWEPRFTYHGFRYVELTGVPAGSSWRPTLESLTARVLCSSAPETDAFACSTPLLNQLWSNIIWTQRDNMPSIPTDCPQRDERMGWTGDILAFGQTAIFNMDMAAFFTKWLQDLRDDQAADGRFADFAPHPFDPNRYFSGVPAWGDAGVFVPWYHWVNYADKKLLAEHFEAARRWVDWIHGQNPDLLWKNKRNNDYGDWLNGDTLKLADFGFPTGGTEVPKELFGTAFFYQSTRYVAKMAEILGRSEDAGTYGRLADDIQAAFNKAYVAEDGTIRGNTQSGYALALDMELLPAEKRPIAARKMREAIRAYKDHMSTGFHTTVRLMNQLTRAGMNDVAYQLINYDSIPSWGYTIKQGATTIWERWDGWVAGRKERDGFQDPGMNSFNHYAIGAVGEWMVRTILGINPDESQPSYRHVILRPLPGGGLSYARGHYDSIRGRIAVDWRIDGDRLLVELSVPANTTATLMLPASGPEAVKEGGKPIAAKGQTLDGAAEGVTFTAFVPASGASGGATPIPDAEGYARSAGRGLAVYTLASGSYSFVSAGFTAPAAR